MPSPSFLEFLYGLSRIPGGASETRDFTQFGAAGRLVANPSIMLADATLKPGAGAFANRLFAALFPDPTARASTAV